MELSGYRIMWMAVMFDLPVMSISQRKAASKFRNFLLDMGFEMSQFSVYLRFCSSKEKVETYCRKIQQNLPEYGKVNILTFTDKQYENIISFTGKKQNPAFKNPDQLILF
ncbi:CRISPR-associated endonuclease Cas2 [Luteithermobacter gelatinilyticus]|uniref:CRISPR-associated endonuclease Cas2 n=1 Tax=Luteithermobacter gelatinilyticus TaxID=2582913 RepID=UPI001AEF3B35|nr:CRISPR-associated endonuclease Cas2 [Luteithermobacter gelatinilyticus]